MTLPNPKFAPRRNDLPWLRRRRRPTVVAAATSTQAAPAAKAAPAVKAAPPAKAAPPRPSASPAQAGPPHASGGKIDYSRPDRDRPSARPAATPPAATVPRTPPPARSTQHPPPTPRPAAASSDHPLDLSRPATPPAPASPPRRTEPAAAASGGNPLDLSGPPSASPPTAPAPSTAGSSLDLSGPTPAPPSSPPASSTLLDLGGGAPPAPSPTPGPDTSLDLGGGTAPSHPSGPPAPRRPPAPAPTRHHVVRRTRRGATTLLQFDAPVVTLDRLQSGVGALTIDAVVGEEAGDLRIGAAWALTDGQSGTVELEAGRRHGPDNRRPVVWAQKEGRFERIAVDLHQSRSLARLLVYGFSASRQTVRWGGTLVVTTYGGDRVDAPIVSAPSPAVLGLLSVYNVDGEFVVRAEMDPVSGTVRDTCRAFGFDRITWLDEHTPIT